MGDLIAEDVSRLVAPRLQRSGGGLGFRVVSIGFRVRGLGFRMKGLGFRKVGIGFRV